MHGRIVAIARRQDGVVTRAQALDAGLTRGEFDGLVRRGHLVALHQGVYHVAGMKTAWTVARGALLAAGWMAAGCHAAGDQPTDGQPAAVASHRLAAVLREYLVPPADALPAAEVITRYGRRGSALTCHRLRLFDDEYSLVRGLPVTIPARTLLDLAGAVGVRELEQALAAAERRGMARKELRLLLRRHPRARGCGALRRLLDHLDDSGTVPGFLRSQLEEEVLAMIRSAGLPEPRTNFAVAGLEVDFAWPRLRLVLEVDGARFHHSRAAFHRDRDRDGRLARAGFVVLRVTYRQVKEHKDRTLATIAVAIGERRLMSAPTVDELPPG